MAILWKKHSEMPQRKAKSKQPSAIKRPSKSFDVEEIRGIVKGWPRGGAYVSVPRAWIGKEVVIRKVKEPKKV
jgi:hypothetical protein